jgi:hypothetical protein
LFSGNLSKRVIVKNCLFFTIFSSLVLILPLLI